MVPAAERLLQLWSQGNPVDIADFLRDSGPLSASDLADVLHVDQHHRWQTGERPAAESYLQRFPALCAETEAAVDVIFHEYLLRERLGERPEVEEYARRFPTYAEAIESQIAFHRLLRENDDSGRQPSSPTSTVSIPTEGTSPRRLASEVQIGLVPRDGLSTGREIQFLLRSRLRLLATISCVGFLIYLPVLWPLFDAITWGTALYGVVLADVAVIGVLLSTRLSFSLRALRWIEVCLFSGMFVFFGYQQVQFFQVGYFSTLALDSWIGPAIAARSMSWPWAVTIISYGILIPNTARRGVVAVAAMVAGFLTITLALALTSTAEPRSAIFGYVLCSVTDMAFAAAIAIFGAYRIATLQQAAAESRKLGPYRLIKRLGAGGMGEVYLAEHALLRRPCALKLIRPEQGSEAHFRSRFEREVQTMANLTHPNTVRVYDYGLAANGTFYYAMEYLPGLSLQELVARHGPLSPGRTVYLLRQVCEALHEAHACGLVHRDIKPANILASQSGGKCDVAKLLDFGLVRVQRLNTTDQSLTVDGGIAGTPAFMSPEQAAGAEVVDQRSDIYSLGAVAYYLLAGRPPFVHPTAVETMAAHLTEAVEPLERLCPDTPADLKAIILRCLEKQPGQRFADIGEVESALANCDCHESWSWQEAADWWRCQGTLATSCSTSRLI